MYNKNEKKIKKSSFSFIKLFIIINCICYNLELFGAIGFLIKFIKKRLEIEKVENYFNFCNEYTTKEMKPFNKVKDPKISVVVPIFNRDRYIVRFLRCIQYQNFEDLEIIFIDDNSIDKGLDMLEEYRKVDKRIVILKNYKTRGSFVSRNIGVLNARGKYVIIPDPDDILYKNILSTCYNFAEKYKYDMLRFAMYTGTEKNSQNDFINGLESRPIYQPELSSQMFYEKNELLMADIFITNKFIKREVYIKGLNSLNAFDSNVYMIFLEEQLMNFILYRTANSYYFIKKIGYYFLRNSMSTTNNIFKVPDLRMHFSFIFLKYLFENTKNTKYEKDMANMLFTNLNRGLNIGQRLNAYNGNFTYYNDIVNMYLNSTYITKENKYMLEDFKAIIERKNRSLALAAAKAKMMMMNATNTTNTTNTTTLNETKENKMNIIDKDKENNKKRNKKKKIKKKKEKENDEDKEKKKENEIINNKEGENEDDMDKKKENKKKRNKEGDDVSNNVNDKEEKKDINKEKKIYKKKKRDNELEKGKNIKEDNAENKVAKDRKKKKDDDKEEKKVDNEEERKVDDKEENKVDDNKKEKSLNDNKKKKVRYNKKEKEKEDEDKDN